MLVSPDEDDLGCVTIDKVCWSPLMRMTCITIDSVLVSPDKDDLMRVTVDKVYWFQYKTESFLSIT